MHFIYLLLSINFYCVVSVLYLKIITKKKMYLLNLSTDHNEKRVYSIK